MKAITYSILFCLLQGIYINQAQAITVYLDAKQPAKVVEKLLKSLGFGAKASPRSRPAPIEVSNSSFYEAIILDPANALPAAFAAVPTVPIVIRITSVPQQISTAMGNSLTLPIEIEIQMKPLIKKIK